MVKVHPLAENTLKCWKERETELQLKKLDVNAWKQTDKKPGHVRIVCISDTHNRTDSLVLPDGDILVHGGDFTMTGLPSEVEHFNEFLARVKPQFKHIVVIAGNHEITFDTESYAMSDIRSSRRSHDGVDPHATKASLKHCIYLEDDSCQLMGVKIYGSPWQPYFMGWGFNVRRGQPCLDKWNKIPDDADVVVTHGPPLGIGDYCFSGLRAGCSELLTTIRDRVKPKLHVFGHIHEGHGLFTDGTTTYANASTYWLNYRPVNPPIVVDLEPRDLC